MRSITRTLLAFSLVFAGLAVGTAASPQGDEARSEHQRIVDFWTADKVRQAIPRDFVLDAASGRFTPAAKGGNRPDGGGGGGGGGGSKGGGGSASVSGADWNNDGVVLESTGKVLFRLGKKANGDDAYWVCSASVVNDDGANESLVVTAAHCVYENTAGSVEFADKWLYIPNYDGVNNELNLVDDQSLICAQTLAGCWTASSLVLHEGFADAGGFNGNAIQYDFAFAVLNNGDTSKDLDEFAQQGIAFDEVNKGSSTYSFGYPHVGFNGELRYCAGDVNFDKRLADLTYKLKCDMTGGASGGPWFSEFNGSPGEGTGVVMSVNSYRYSGGGGMYGPKFNTSTGDLFNAARDAGANCILLASGVCRP